MNACPHPDWHNRKRLASAIRSYLDDGITAIQFDEVIHDIAADTEDQTIVTIVSTLWSCYDDCTDHQAVLDKIHWDLFQRLLLILESGAHVRAETRWAPIALKQILALCGLVIFAIGVWQTSWTLALLAWILPLGLFSIGLSWFGSKQPEPDAKDAALYPFASRRDIMVCRRAASGFRKRRFRRELSGRTIRGPAAVMWLTVQRYLLWMLASPVILLTQAWPWKKTTEIVELPS